MAVKMIEYETGIRLANAIELRNRKANAPAPHDNPATRL
jgi:hypothetical protein